MMPLTLAAFLSVGADPVPAYMPGPLPGPRVPVPGPLHPIERIKAKVANLALPGTVAPGGPSFLYQPAFEEDKIIRGPARPYVPQPGDIVMSADGSKFWKLMHNLAGTSHPTHSMIVFAMPDGRPAILEGGPHDTLKCRILEAIPHMASYEEEGRVWVRRRSVPLTPEESCRLTQFCLYLDGRDFSIRRLAVQLTPFRTRGPVRTMLVGRPQGPDRKEYFCSELVVEACVYAGLMDAETARPSATYPRDLFFSGVTNIYLSKHMKAMNCTWEAPARWTHCPITPVVER